MSHPESSRLAVYAALLFTLSLPVAAYALVPVSPYVSTLSLVYDFRGATRDYSGPGVYISVDKPSCNTAGTYTISLYRDKLIDSRIGTVTRDRNKSGGATWTNAGSGRYYFRFQKSGDGATVTSKRVVMGSR